MNAGQLKALKKINAAANRNCPKDQSSLTMKVILGASAVAGALVVMPALAKMAGL